MKRNLSLTKISVSYIIPLFGSFYLGCPRTLRTTLVHVLSLYNYDKIQNPMYLHAKKNVPFFFFNHSHMVHLILFLQVIGFNKFIPHKAMINKFLDYHPRPPRFLRPPRIYYFFYFLKKYENSILHHNYNRVWYSVVNRHIGAGSLPTVTLNRMVYYSNIH
jgi:hypothetical protein